MLARCSNPFPQAMQCMRLTFLGNFEGILQSDGYAAYDHVGGPKIVHAGCQAHARRKFFQAVELNPKDQDALRIVAQMDELFAMDA
jgi:transposase